MLWGERATTFDGDALIELGTTEPVVALFVGTLVKTYEGRRGDLQTKTVNQLLALNIYENRDVCFLCSVTLTRLCLGQRWWFSSCTKCHKSSQPYETIYRCIDPDCSFTDAVPRYCICFIDADDTDEAEFIFFDRARKDIVGKSLITLLRDG